jgi:ABC-type glycerol-3-phosphate transport system substrate-binding protein
MGQAVFWYFRELFKYAPERAWELEQVEVCLQMMSEKDIAIADAIWVGAFIRNWIDEPWFQEKMEFWHMPVDKRYWRPGMPSHDDISDLVLTKAGKNKEAAWLYIQFTQSKAIDIYKHIDSKLCNMVRLSTLYSEYADEFDKKSKGLIASLRHKHFIDATSDDPAYIDRAGLVRTLHPLWAKLIRDPKIDPADAMTQVADALDKLARETGAMA